MGIRYLNKYFVENCKECIQLMHMNELYGKTIVVDISIYLYKYQMSDSLIENMYLMLSLFECHDITPIFIFDGKPPVEKMDVLNKRYHEKVKAESEYNELYKKLDNRKLSARERESVLETMQNLKRKCVFLKKDHIHQVQDLINSYGYTYYTANGEADELCAAFVRAKKAWACLSEDMDMFVYGVPRVLRYMSLLNNTVVMYDTHKILKRIGISRQDFMELCIMTGSDYTTDTVMDVYALFKLFHVYAGTPLSKNMSFRHWLQVHGEAYSVESMNDETFSSIRNLFIRTTEETSVLVASATSFRREPDRQKIQRILEADGFVYPVT